MGIYEEKAKLQREQKVDREVKGTQIKSFLKDSLWDFLIVVIVLVYVATGLINIQESGRSIVEIIATGGIAFIFGYTISLLFTAKGLIKGDLHPDVIQANKDHEEAYRKALPYIDLGDDWCEIQNKKALRQVRERILSRSAMAYKDYFDEDGRVKNVEVEEITKDMSKLKKRFILRKQKTLERAINARVTHLIMGDLISESGDAMDPNNMGETKASYQKKTAVKGVLGKLLPAVIVGYFSISLVSELSLANFIWTAFQSLLFIVMGYLKYLNAFYFVSDTYKKSVNKRTAFLENFISWAKEEVKKNGTINTGGTSTPKTTVVPTTTTSDNQSSETVSDDAETTTPTKPIPSETRLPVSKDASTGRLLPTQ